MLNEARAEAALKHEQWVILLGLAGVSALAWVYLVYLITGSRDMTTMESAMPQMGPWGGPDLALTFAMWAVMMVAMMLPFAAPVTLLFVAIQRSQLAPRVVRLRTLAFLLGYLAVWIGFAGLATAAQWGLHTAALVSSLASAGPLLGGVLLVVAGLFQWTPFKHACLARCRSPQGFFIAEWREGLRGAGQMGLKHGLYCVGCCWLLMALLLLTGAMNLLWMALLTALILVEKAAPAGVGVSRAAGLLLIGSGLWIVAGPSLLRPG